MVQGKATNAGLYIPLLVPNRPWTALNMDFLLGLTPTQQRVDSIMVVAERLSKNGSLHRLSKTNGYYY